MSKFEKFINDMFGAFAGIFDNMMKSVFKSDITDQDKAGIDYAVKAQEESFLRTQSMPALVAQYKEAGVNPMMLAGQGVGSVPSASNANTNNQGLDVGKMIESLLGYKNESRRLDLQEQLLPYQQDALSAQAGLSNTRANEINTLLPERVENLRQNTNLLIERCFTEQGQQALAAAGVTQKEAEAALLIRQEAILAIDEKNRQRFLEIEMDLKQANARMARAASARDFAEVARISQETRNLQVEHDNLLKEGVGIALNNGKLAHEFNIVAKEDANTETRLKQENAQRVVGMVCDGINTVVGVVGAATGVGNMTAALKSAAASESRASTYESNSHYTETEEYYNDKGKIKGRKYKTHK